MTGLLSRLAARAGSGAPTPGRGLLTSPVRPRFAPVDAPSDLEIGPLEETSAEAPAAQRPRVMAKAPAPGRARKKALPDRQAHTPAMATDDQIERVREPYEQPQARPLREEPSVTRQPLLADTTAVQELASEPKALAERPEATEPALPSNALQEKFAQTTEPAPTAPLPDATPVETPAALEVAAALVETPTERGDAPVGVPLPEAAEVVDDSIPSQERTEAVPSDPLAPTMVEIEQGETGGLSIGRIDVVFESPAPPAPPPIRRRQMPARTRGFSGYERARLGQRR